MTAERAVRVIEDPHGRLDTALIDEFLHTRGTDRTHLRELPDDGAALMKKASAYATARLANWIRERIS